MVLIAVLTLRSRSYLELDFLRVRLVDEIVQVRDKVSYIRARDASEIGCLNVAVVQPTYPLTPSLQLYSPLRMVLYQRYAFHLPQRSLVSLNNYFNSITNQVQCPICTLSIGQSRFTVAREYDLSTYQVM